MMSLFLYPPWPQGHAPLPPMPIGSTPPRAACLPAAAAALASPAASAQADYYVSSYVPEPVGANPTALAFDPVNRKLFVANHDDDTVTVLQADVQSVAPIATVSVGHQPNHIAINSETGAVYVSN